MFFIRASVNGYKLKKKDKKKDEILFGFLFILPSFVFIQQKKKTLPSKT